VPGAREVPPDGPSSAAVRRDGVMILVIEDPLLGEVVGMVVRMDAYRPVQDSDI
jgi:hypothetical protein